jgi:hypothetical protein
MNLIITYKNGEADVFEEKNLDCSSLTIKGHAAKLIEEWKGTTRSVYVLDHYNAVALDEIICVRVT